MSIRLALAAALILPPALRAVSEPDAPLMTGAAWYPEQWPQARWEADLELMERAHLGFVRIGEFAWSSLEPQEGRYDLDWMAQAIAAAGRHHLAVVIGTPTDAPPAWLTRRYPDTLRVDSEGRRMQHGARRQFSYASERYRELCRDIVSVLGRRFGHDPRVVAWQIGNEFTEDSYDPDAQRQFHAWLRTKYGTLDALNRRWVTAYWSQTYDDWDEIPLGSAAGNPGLRLDYQRFVTDTWRGFAANQIAALRAVADPRQRITTNLGGLGWADRFDRRKLADDFDFIAWDEYVGRGHLDPVRGGATNDLVRGWRGGNFWVMEMQPGFVDWAPISNALDPGETRAMAWEAVGHGADAVAFWQWRAALNGQEQYHGTLVGPDGAPVPFYGEAARIGAEFQRAAPLLRGTQPSSQVALLHDYDSRWAIEFHPQTVRYDPVDVLLRWYAALRPQTQAVDIVDPTDPRCDLSRYRLVIAPGLNVLPEVLAARLRAYVRGGGHLVLGARSGMKDADNALWPQRQPGPLAADLETRVDEYYALLDGVPVAGALGAGTASIWAETLGEPAEGTVLLRYVGANGWLAGHPAAVERTLGKGTLAYVGTLLDGAALRAAAGRLCQEAGVATVADPGSDGRILRVPEGVEVCRRSGAGKDVYVLINFAPGPVAIDLARPLQDAFGGGDTRRVFLPRHGVGVLWAAARQP